MLPSRILTDQSSQLGDEFIHLAGVSDVKVEKTGIKSYSSLGLGEQYHEPLRRTLRKIMANQPTTDKDHALASSVKVMNDTFGPERHVPSALIFGKLPQLLAVPMMLPMRPKLMETNKIAKTAQREMEVEIYKPILRRVIHHTVPPSSDRSYPPED